MRLVILGGPRTGKTTWAKSLSAIDATAVLHTDDLMDREWSKASEEASAWFDRDGDWIIEGTMAVRALRKWLEKNPEKKLEATVLYLSEPVAAYDKRGQEAMAKGCQTIFDGIAGDLKRRCIRCEVGSAAMNYLKNLALNS